jgi:hypothetical protein
MENDVIQSALGFLASRPNLGVNGANTKIRNHPRLTLAFMRLDISDQYDSSAGSRVSGARAVSGCERGAILCNRTHFYNIDSALSSPVRQDGS